MTEIADSQVMELRPRCLVVVPGLSFEEFEERVWNPIRATHESLNFLIGDALVYADRFGEAASQLVDERLTPSRMGQLKWVAEAIPPARRREDCSWTVHRYVAGLFGRKRAGGTIYPAHYLDRKAELQDELLAKAATEKWHSDSVKQAVDDLEEEARNSLSNKGPALDSEPEPEVEPEEVAASTDDAEIEALLDDAAGEIEDLADDLKSNPQELDRAEIRACIEAVRAAPAVPLEAARRIAVALGRPALDVGNTDQLLAAFPPGWRKRIEEQIDGVTVRWSMLAMKAGAQRAMGVNSVLAYAVAEAALSAILSDLDYEEPKALPAPPSIAAPAAEPAPPAPPAPPEPDTPLMAAFKSAGALKALRDWVLIDDALGNPAPDGEASQPFITLWQASAEDDRKALRKALLNI